MFFDCFHTDCALYRCVDDHANANNCLKIFKALCAENNSSAITFATLPWHFSYKEKKTLCR